MAVWTLDDLASGKNMEKLVLDNGKTIEQTFKYEIGVLSELLEESMVEFYLSYNPQQYERKWLLYDALPKGNVAVSVSGTNLSAALKFGNGVMHRSAFGSSANVLPLMEYGYRVKKNVWFKRLPYFGYRDGNHFVARAIKTFQQLDTLGVEVSVEYDHY